MNEAFEEWLKSRPDVVAYTSTSLLSLKEVFYAGYEAGYERGEDAGYLR